MTLQGTEGAPASGREIIEIPVSAVDVVCDVGEVEVETVTEPESSPCGGIAEAAPVAEVLVDQSVVDMPVDAFSPVPSVSTTGPHPSTMTKPKKLPPCHQATAHHILEVGRSHEPTNSPAR